MSHDQEFDVFLSYNSSDRATVMRMAKQLSDRDLSVWLDVWELRPGIRWQPELEEALKRSRAVAVVIGKNGMGPWEVEEMLASIDRRARPFPLSRCSYEARQRSLRSPCSWAPARGWISARASIRRESTS